MVALGANLDDVECLSEPALRGRVAELLPAPVAQSLFRLAVHARPLPRRYLAGDVDDAAVQIGKDLGLWNEVGENLIAELGWGDFAKAWLPVESRRRIHIDLANVFLADFRLDDPTSSRVGLSVLEAHRHLVEAGDFDRVRDCWRYGAPLLIEAARERSLAQDFDTAAQLYGHVVHAVDRDELALPKRLRAYARHYLHFNRAHGELEDYSATERGYRRALEVAGLVRAYTPDLGAADRLRKRLLLGAVNILASRVDAPTAGAYWYFGVLQRDEKGALWLRTGGCRDLWFEIPEELAITVVVDDLPHLAHVATDEQGVPVGPVIKLETGFRGSEEDLWAEWRRLLSDAG